MHWLIDWTYPGPATTQTPPATTMSSGSGSSGTGNSGAGSGGTGSGTNTGSSGSGSGSGTGGSRTVPSGGNVGSQSVTTLRTTTTTQKSVSSSTTPNGQSGQSHFLGIIWFSHPRLHFMPSSWNGHKNKMLHLSVCHFDLTLRK